MNRTTLTTSDRWTRRRFKSSGRYPCACINQTVHQQEVTDAHPFWVVTNDPDLERAAREYGDGFYHENLEGINGFWVEAKDLREGDVFFGANGELLTFVSKERVELEEPITVYNFTVAGNHNYFVIAETDEYGQTCVLVHNGGDGGNGKLTWWQFIKELVSSTASTVTSGGLGIFLARTIANRLVGTPASVAATALGAITVVPDYIRLKSYIKYIDEWTKDPLNPPTPPPIIAKDFGQQPLPQPQQLRPHIQPQPLQPCLTTQQTQEIQRELWQIPGLQQWLNQKWEQMQWVQWQW